MSLDAFSPTTISGYVHVGTAETGMIVENFSKQIGTSNKDMGLDPATGKAVLVGYHSDEIITGTISGITYGTTVWMAATIGASVTMATSVALAGYVGTGRTTVCTDINFTKDNTGGKFQRGEWGYDSLPFVTT